MTYFTPYHVDYKDRNKRGEYKFMVTDQRQRKIRKRRCQGESRAKNSGRKFHDEEPKTEEERSMMKGHRQRKKVP